MTKFEEEFKALTSWDWINVDLIQQILTKFGNWHSDEEFQIVEEIGGSFALANKNLIDANTKLTEEIADLKSRLQQQALPVVPECVAEWYEGCAPIPVETCITDFLFNYQKEKSVDDGTEFEQWFIRTDNSIEILMDMKRLGYEVEKPQLFYLKNKLTTSYLILDTSTGYFEHWGSTEATGRYKSSFTQQEIGSMETGSYEQIEVAE